MWYLRRPWVWLGGGSRRVVASYAGRYNDEKWNYELIKSWMLGLEINQDYYGRHPARFSQWGAAKRVAFCALLALAFATASARHSDEVDGARWMLAHACLWIPTVDVCFVWLVWR